MEGAARAILAAAGRLGVTLTEHTTVMRRAKAAVGELDTCLAAVNAAGMLSFFNREYRVRRLAAHAAGRSFLPYAEAHRRLRMAARFGRGNRIHAGVDAPGVRGVRSGGTCR